MTTWARLTWQAADPAELAADLERRLGASGQARVVLGAARVMHLGDADLELVPWRPEAPDDHPHAGGRLVFEPAELVPGGAAVDDPSGDAHASAGAILATPALALAGVCWATVELDRAEAELDPWLEPAEVLGDATEPHLGARTRTRLSPGLPGRALVLAEPVTEGRLAASLARDGEGPCALYLEPAEGLEAWRAAAIRRGALVSAIHDGPLGPSVLLAGIPSGPHLVVVDHPLPGSRRPSLPGGTIGP